MQPKSFNKPLVQLAALIALQLVEGVHVLVQRIQQPAAEDVIDEGLINLGDIWTLRQTLILQNCDPVERLKTASHEQDGRTSRSPASQAPTPTQVRGAWALCNWRVPAVLSAL